MLQLKSMYLRGNTKKVDQGKWILKSAIKSCQIVPLCSKIISKIYNYSVFCSGCLLWFTFLCLQGLVYGTYRLGCRCMTVLLTDTKTVLKAQGKENSAGSRILYSCILLMTIISSHWFITVNFGQNTKHVCRIIFIPILYVHHVISAGRRMIKLALNIKLFIYLLVFCWIKTIPLQVL